MTQSQKKTLGVQVFAIPEEEHIINESDVHKLPGNKPQPQKNIVMDPWLHLLCICSKEYPCLISKGGKTLGPIKAQCPRVEECQGGREEEVGT